MRWYDRDKGITIRDFEARPSELSRIKDLARKKRYYALSDDLEWVPVKERLPYNGQMIIASKSNGFDSWNEVVYYNDGVFFDIGWNWASAADTFDAWMPMPLPYNMERARNTSINRGGDP